MILVWHNGGEYSDRHIAFLRLDGGLYTTEDAESALSYERLPDGTNRLVPR